MLSEDDLIRLPFPNRKFATGQFVVSSENEYLFVFKDSIGIFIPHLQLTSGSTSLPPDRMESRVKFFLTSPENERPLFQFELNPGDDLPPLEVSRYAISYIDSSILALTCKVVDQRDYLVDAFRNADWSPAGLDSMSRAVFSCVTGSHQLLLCCRCEQQWRCCVNLSSLWMAYWRRYGLQLLSEGDSKHIFFPVPTAAATAQGSVASSTHSDETEAMEFDDVLKYYTSVAEACVLSSSWSKKLVFASERKDLGQNALLVALHLSGSITFWDVSAPLLDENSTFLTAVDRTYTVAFQPPNFPPRPSFVKVIDLEDQEFLIVIGFTNGRVVCDSYSVYAKNVGRLCVKKLSSTEIFAGFSMPVVYSDATFREGTLVVTYGTQVLLASVFNSSNIKFRAIVSDNAILKAVSGVAIFEGQVYFTSQDGHLAKFAIATQLNRRSPVSIIYETSSSGTKGFHPSFGGLHITRNGVYAVFMEVSMAPAFCNVSSNVVFLSLVSNKAALGLIDQLRPPMRMNADLYHRIAGMLKNVDSVKPVAEDDIDMDNQAFFTSLLSLCDGSGGLCSGDLSKVETSKIQFYRSLSAALMEKSSKLPEIAGKIEAQIARLDAVLALRQIDLCYRLFLKAEVQRQAQDCVLVIRIAELCRRYLNSPNAKAVNAAAPSFCALISRGTEAVLSIAPKILSQRFQQSLVEVNAEALLICPVCMGQDMSPDLISVSCPKGHRFERCISTFIPCIDPTFNECPWCKRCSVVLPERPSQWRKEINGRYCTYCNLPLKLVNL